MPSHEHDAILTTEDQARRTEEDAEIRRRLSGGVGASLITLELLGHGLPLELAAARVARLQQRALLSNGVRQLIFGAMLIAFGVFLIVELRFERAGILLLVISAIQIGGGALRLLRAGGPGGAQRLARELEASTAGIVEAATNAPQDWIELALRQAYESRICLLRWVALISLVGVATIPLALASWWSARRMRRESERAIALLRQRSSALVWAYLELIDTYGFTFAWLTLGEVSPQGKGRLIRLPVPIADAGRILDTVASRLPGIHLGISQETKRRFHSDPRSLRSVSAAPGLEAESSVVTIGASALDLSSRQAP
ncbi:MAG: hypothetical protein IPN34_23045 [Planctomycetes bacterium]|nr:hypothetical protein [Planctomycetota bacterium]